MNYKMREVTLRSADTREAIELEIAGMFPPGVIRLSASHSQLFQVYYDSVWQQDMCVKFRNNRYDFIQKQIHGRA